MGGALPVVPESHLGCAKPARIARELCDVSKVARKLLFGHVLSDRFRLVKVEELLNFGIGSHDQLA